MGVDIVGSKKAIVIVDPISTGAQVASGASDRGYAVIRLWSSDCPPELRGHTSSVARDVFSHTLEHVGGSATEVLEVTAQALLALPYAIEAILCGSEPGVNLSDALSFHMGLRGNGTALAHVRRNKFNQSEAVRDTGMRAVRQVLAKSVAEAAAFLPQLGSDVASFRAIVKPVESAGSEDVKLCVSHAEVFAHLTAVLGTRNALGQDNDAVLVQEFLLGVEYIVDCVTKDGVHKCCAVWAYDKRPVNGAPFIYFGQRPLSVADPIVRKVIVYTLGVLDALGISNGATHSEMIVDAATGEPCLVECNCRTHGGNGEWVPVVEALLGYSQVSALLDAFLHPAAFDALPAEPQPLRGSGMLVFLPNYRAGKLLAAPGLELLQGLRSHARSALEVHIGSDIVKTINVFTELGIAVLLHELAEVVEADYKLLHELCAAPNFLVMEGDSAEVASNDAKPVAEEAAIEVLAA
ncbi:ATP-grasp domain-containing protein [Pavlovales sp. CCMP2436]|nr:ATP-grasp domain-containing protein [Pavlovales sp. CCMP2436]